MPCGAVRSIPNRHIPIYNCVRDCHTHLPNTASSCTVTRNVHYGISGLRARARYRFLTQPTSVVRICLVSHGKHSRRLYRSTKSNVHCPVWEYSFFFHKFESYRYVKLLLLLPTFYVLSTYRLYRSIHLFIDYPSIAPYITDLSNLLNDFTLYN